LAGPTRPFGESAVLKNIESVHLAVLLATSTQVPKVLDDLRSGRVSGSPIAFDWILSQQRIEYWIEQEYRHGQSDLSRTGGPELRRLSSGQRKLAAFRHGIQALGEVAVLVDPWEYLDPDARSWVSARIDELRDRIQWVFLVYDREDIPDCTHRIFRVSGTPPYNYIESIGGQAPRSTGAMNSDDALSAPEELPPPPSPALSFDGKWIFELRNLKVSYADHPVLNGLNWSVRPGEIWWLKGPNGSGKSTLVSMIIGDNPKAYGQDIHLFGKKKGSGESVWDIKRWIGYFTPLQVEGFRGAHSLLEMIVSGLQDSLGLYVRPTDQQLRLGKAWVRLMGMEGREQQSFQSLSKGEKNLVMTVRALVKHPPLVILDEPTTGLSPTESTAYARLVMNFCALSSAALIWVAHTEIREIQPDFVLELVPGPRGSTYRIRKRP